MDVEQYLLTREHAIRFGVFLAVFTLVALWEIAAPRRQATLSKALRWSNNISLMALNTLLLRLVFPLATVGVAAFGEASGWGLLNHFQVPLWIAVPIAVIVLDFAI